MCCIPTKVVFGSLHCGFDRRGGPPAGTPCARHRGGEEHGEDRGTGAGHAGSGEGGRGRDRLPGGRVRSRPSPRSTTSPTCAGKEGCRVVVGLGGGSAIDFAKGVAVAGTHEGTVIDYMTRVGYPSKPITERTLPIVAVPTTAGTGAEVTSVAVITIPGDHEKHGIINPRVFPRVAIVDPGLTLSLPARLTAGTGFDVFAHAFEAFASKFTTPFADMVALEAMRLVGGHCGVAVRECEDAVAREHMAWASTLGGMAIANAVMTVAHGIAQALGGRFHIAHGEAVASCLPEVMEQMVPSRADRLARVAEAMGICVAKGGGNSFRGGGGLLASWGVGCGSRSGSWRRFQGVIGDDGRGLAEAFFCSRERRAASAKKCSQNPAPLGARQRSRQAGG